jgi:hypothetical protein
VLYKPRGKSIILVPPFLMALFEMDNEAAIIAGDKRSMLENFIDGLLEGFPPCLVHSCLSPGDFYGIPIAAHFPSSLSA